MKTLIFQYKYFHGVLNANEEYSSNLWPATRDTCVGTVPHYCARHGYDYRLFQQEPDDIPEVFPAYRDNVALYFVNLFGQLADEDYDRYLYLDIDVRAEPDAPPLPELTADVNMVRQPAGSRTLNSGVIYTNTDGARQIAKLLDYDNYDCPDQKLVNANLHMLNWAEMDVRWNWRAAEGPGGYLTHFYSRQSKNMLEAMS